MSQCLTKGMSLWPGLFQQGCTSLKFCYNPVVPLADDQAFNTKVIFQNKTIGSTFVLWLLIHLSTPSKNLAKTNKNSWESTNKIDNKITCLILTLVKFITNGWVLSATASNVTVGLYEMTQNWPLALWMRSWEVIVRWTILWSYGLIKVEYKKKTMERKK